MENQVQWMYTDRFYVFTHRPVFLIVFDTKTPVGEDCEPQYHEVGNKRITSFTIAIGKDS